MTPDRMPSAAGISRPMTVGNEKNTIKSNRYKIINKINHIQVIDFIVYFILFGRLKRKAKPHPSLPLELV